MDEYKGFWVNGKGSGIEGFSRGNGGGDGYGFGHEFGNGFGGGFGSGDGSGYSHPTKDHREG